ncbi:MAG: serine hydrolase, partial [Gammaproteobacteria bacterium]|nr:serine hydrolase [Gammaproteobacteria bacterium]
REGRISRYERTAWSVYDFQTKKKLVAINENSPMQAASMIKVFVALAYFYLNSQAPRKYPYGSRERYLMQKMLVNSSNKATNTLMRMCKGPANVKRLCQLATKHRFKQLRIVEYIPSGGRTYRNKVSAHDYSRFLYDLWHNRLPHSAELKRIMSIKNHDRITSEIMSPSTRVFDKTGSTGRLCGDMGIVQLSPHRAYTFVGIIERSHKTRSYGRWISVRSDAIREASELVYRFMKDYR